MGSTALSQNTPASAFDPATHSGRLKYADAQHLPSFPSTGLRKDGTAASVAASLGWANAKPFSHWTPDSSGAASAAALLASDGKMATGADSRHGTPGSQAATRAIGSAQRQPQSQPSPQSSAWGSSAALLAFNRANMSSSPTGEDTGLTRQGSMHAAKGAMRRRSRSSPTSSKESYPDQANAASNALSAATMAHRPSMQSSNIPLEGAGAVPYTTMDKQMFTSHPPVKPEVEEQKRNDVLHASAVAMAKKMYSQQQSVINAHRTTTLARSSSFTRHGGAATSDVEQHVGFSNLQEAAYSLAQQRLAKLQQEHQMSRSLEDYYGSAASQPRGKLGGLRSKLTRRRSASDGALVEDKRRSMQIRKQMSLFDTRVAEVDEQQRARDREALLAAAQRNVQARLRTMDAQIQEETGWIAPATKDDWAWRARAAAQAKFDASRLEEQRKVDIGGGVRMDREAVEAIAAKRVQPLLDEINEKAERERERRAQQKMEEDKQKEEAERNMMRDREVQEIHKQLKEQQKEKEKARRAEIKREERTRKEDEKALRAQQKRLARNEKQMGKQMIHPEATVDESPREQESPREPEDDRSGSRRHSRALSINFTKRLTRRRSRDLAERSPTPDGESSPSPVNKVKTWLKSRFSRPRSHSSPTTIGEGSKTNFVGGATLTRMADRENNPRPIDERKSASMREVAMAGLEMDGSFASGEQRAVDEPGESSTPSRPAQTVARRIRTPSPKRRDDESTSLSTQSVSSMSSLDKFEEARTTPSSLPVTPPRFVRVGGGGGQGSPARGSRFSEILE